MDAQYVDSGTLRGTLWPVESSRQGGRSSNGRTAVVQGADADRLLADPDFVSRWQELAASCRWTTGFQTPAYARTWYRSYRPDYEPVLVVRGSAKAPLQGLLLLARGRDGLVHAGGAAAEYQTWICEPELAESFPDEAFEALGAEPVTLRYLPPRTPLAWFEGSRLAERAKRTRQVRPLMRTDAGAIEASLRKKSNRSRYNRLKRIGSVRLERIVGSEALDAVFDRIIDQHDLRYGATYDTPSFRSQPNRRRFYLDLAEHPEVLHVTVLWAGEHIAAAHVGVLSEGELQLGFIAFHPRLGRQSPGKLMLLLLGQRLAEEGMTFLDLTPGGDPYKERFATEHDEVSTLQVYRDRTQRLRVSAVEQAADAARWGIRQVGLQPREVRARVEALHPARVLSEARRRIRLSGDGRLYEHDLSDLPESEGEPFPRNDLRALLRYSPGRGDPTRQAFLTEALARFEQKAHCYTAVIDGALAAVTWLAPIFGVVQLPVVESEWKFERGAALITTSAFGPYAGQHELRSIPMRQILADAKGMKKVSRVYVVVPGLEENHEWLSALGFNRLASFSTTIRIVKPS